MGGEMQVRSEPGQGSIFERRVYLPAVAAPEDPRARGKRHRRLCGRAQARAGGGRPGRRSASCSRNCWPCWASKPARPASGEQCLREAARPRPDMILLDIAMPGIDGWEVSRLLRASEATRVPIIMVSANAHEQRSGKARARRLRRFPGEARDRDRIAEQAPDPPRAGMDLRNSPAAPVPAEASGATAAAARRARCATCRRWAPSAT